ncbi:MAG: hypothetical protein LBP70_00705 [Mycoplasmataceae bacterium]|nr:hypothetical protein [Mycoplasmataceae bacterium]
MDQKKIIGEKVFTTLEIVYVSNDYIDRLNVFLNPSNDQNISTAHWNKQIKIRNRKTGLKILTKYYRPTLVFDFDSNKSSHKCFPLSSYKTTKDKLNDQRYGYVEDNGKIKGKIILTKPIQVPTKYLIIINPNIEIKTEKIPEIREWLHNLNIEKREFERKSKIFWKQYLNIKYSREVDYINYSKANMQLIDENKVERFCNMELSEILKNK